MTVPNEGGKSIIMRKICILMDYMIIGGVEKVLIETIEILNKSNKFDIILVVLSGKIKKSIESNKKICS